MTITYSNYHEILPELDFSKLPEVLRKGKEYLDKVTDKGVNWETYHASETIRKVVDAYFDKLSAFANNTALDVRKSVPAKSKVVKAVKEKPARVVSADNADVANPTLVERIQEELKFIKRYVNLDGKTKTKKEMLSFVNSLQKAILEKRIRKTSQYAKEITYVQDALIRLYNGMADKIVLTLKPETREKLIKLTGVEKVYPSVAFIKRYIGLNGKAGMKEKAKMLFNQIEKAYENGTISAKDPYVRELAEIKENLEEFIGKETVRILMIEKNTLNGLEGILGCNCQQLNGIEDGQVVMNSMDFANMQFDTLGFSGKWLDLIGDPSANFTVMVYGKPKFGKSYLCVDFAGYLARNHGRVLYVAKEESLGRTLQDKLNDKNVKHPNLFVTSVLPGDLSFYDFIFLDSVNSLGLLAEDLRKLKEYYPTKSFIYVFQVTKEGNFRGANTFQHDVDSVIEVPEKGKAVQYGRFNAGGEMDIFS